MRPMKYPILEIEESDDYGALIYYLFMTLQICKQKK